MSMQQQVAALPPMAGTPTGLCVGDGTSGNRVQVLYVHAPGNDRFAQYKASFEQWAVDMDTIYNESAKATGGSRRIRYVHNAACAPVVLNVEVSSAALSSFSGMIGELEAKGYNRTDRKYATFGDVNVYCGIGEFAGDDRKTSTNRSNFGPSFSRTDASCWGGTVLAHELGHNLGAVNNNAPNTSGGAHCTDEYDVMCYSDSPNHPQMRYLCADRAMENRLDCNHDDYYNTNPSPTSYLGTHWNVADSVFLIGGATPANDFSLSVTPGSGNTSPGGSVTTTAATATTNGSAQTVTFSASGLPGGATASFNPSSVTSGASSILTIATTSVSPPGTYTVTITATGTGTQITRTATYRLNITGTSVTVVTGGRALDDPASATTPGTQMTIFTLHGRANQQWRITRNTDGTYTLVNGASGLCLDVKGASKKTGAAIIQWICNGNANQRWVITTSGGLSKITSKNSGLTLTAASATNGAKVTQAADTGSARQRWTLTAV